MVQATARMFRISSAGTATLSTSFRGTCALASGFGIVVSNWLWIEVVRVPHRLESKDFVRNDKSKAVGYRAYPPEDAPRSPGGLDLGREGPTDGPTNRSRVGKGPSGIDQPSPMRREPYGACTT